MSEAVAKGKEYVKGKTPWRYRRYFFYGFITIVALALPWIKVNGNHLFLLSFDKLKLHLMFVQFDMQELYLMPFLLMILFIGIFGLTVFGGRIFCGWACPQTIFRVIYRDLIETKLLGLRKRIANKQQEPDYSKPENQIKRVVAVVLWTVLSMVAAADFLWYFVPPEDFLAYMSNPGDHGVLVTTFAIITGFLVADIIFIKENFCVYVCPYSRIQSVLYDDDTIQAIYDPHRGGVIYDENKEKMFTKQKELLEVAPDAECTTCESCVTVCPTHIDIRRGMQLECINCLECVDACTDVMGKLGKASLVRWSSDREVVHQAGKTRYLRPKIIGYMVVLLIVSVILGMMGSEKEYMLLNINKENRLYSVQKTAEGDVKVDNSYIFLLQNTLNENHKYYFEIITPENMQGKIYIDRPSKPFVARPGIKKKTIVTLSTTDVLVQDDRKDTIIPITIKAYAIDDKEKVVVYRKSTFTYPRYDIIQEAE